MITLMQPKRLFQCLSLLALSLVFLHSSTPVRAQSTVILTAEAGFDAHYAENQWVPVRITLENPGADLTGWVEIVTSSDGDAQTIYSYDVSLPSGAHKQLNLNIFLSYNTRELLIRFLAAGDVLTSVSTRLNQMYATDRLYGILSDHPTPYNLLADLDPLNGSAVIVPLKISDLPDNPASWASLGVLIISDVDTGLLSPAQQTALEQWLVKGGHLLVIGGAQWPKTTAGIRYLLPFSPRSSTTLTSLDHLASFSQSDFSLPNPASFVVTTGTLADDAQVLLSQDEIPILVRRQFGGGRVDFLAVEPALEPLRSWDGMLELYQAIFYPLAASPAWNNGVINWDAAREAAGTLPELALPHALTIVCFLGLYIAVLGPLNYLVLKKVKRREWAWITIPLIVLIFSIAAILVGSLSRGSRPVLNRMAIIQVWPASDKASVSGVVGIYSPRPATVDLTIEDTSLVHTIPPAWDSNLYEATLRNENGWQTIPGLRISAGETIPMVFDGSIPSPSITSDLVLEINPSGATISGTVTNNSELILNDAALIYPGGKLTIGDFPPGQTQVDYVQLDRAQLFNPQPVSNTYVYNGVYYPYNVMYYALPDTTYQDIIGNADYYNDRQAYRRFVLLNTHLPNNSNSGRGGGIYLTGWVESFPVAITLADQHYRLVDTSLYIVALSPHLHTSGNIWELSPGLFTFSSPADNPASSLGPYQFSIYASESCDWVFTLANPLVYSAVHQFEINLTSSQSSLFPASLDVYLWDYQQAQWIQQDIGAWGAYSVPQPARYVSSASEVQLRLVNNDVNSIFIDTADITLQVIP